MFDEKFDKQKALRLLRDRGIVRAELQFSGGNDEGGVDVAKFYDEKGEEVSVTERAYRSHQWDAVRGRWNDLGWKAYDSNGRETDATPEQIAESELFETCAASVYERYGSFAGEFEVHGVVKFDVKAGTVLMEVSESTPHWTDTSEEL